MKRYFSIMGILMLCLFGCSEDPLQTEPVELTSVSVDDIPPVNTTYTGNVFIGEAGNRFGADEFDLNTAAIEGDILKVNLSYSGGCKSHQFTLVASDSFMESDPVQLSIYIAHNANGDTCEAYPTEDYHFNLTPIKNLYQKYYQQNTGTIILRLRDAPDNALIYKFTM